MIARTQRYDPRPWPRRALAAIGATTISGATRLLLFMSFAATVAFVALRREAWRGPVWVAFQRVLNEVVPRVLGDG